MESSGRLKANSAVGANDGEMPSSVLASRSGRRPRGVRLAGLGGRNDTIRSPPGRDAAECPR